MIKNRRQPDKQPAHSIQAPPEPDNPAAAKASRDRQAAHKPDSRLRKEPLPPKRLFTTGRGS
jgi:hypothetical protein